jgi:predicted metal-dependent peptidase
VAAVDVHLGEIHLNPNRHLGLEECKFVLAHEALHAGLDHAQRRQGRDPRLWNVACDFVINDWLVELGIGRPPVDGGLYEPGLRGQSAEDIYIALAGDLRILRRLQQGKDLCEGDWRDLVMDVPGASRQGPWQDRAAWCRAALLQGLDFHLACGRDTLPAGLVETIRTLNQPPIPWQTRLAQWLQERFPLPERRRSWARPSRRQAASPDIPRPRLVAPEEDRATRTFGVVVDSSGSMDREELGKALGAIVAYAGAQDVRQVRLVYCDATPYDEGYVAVEALAERVRVRGRGGTVLQGAIDLLQTRQDFPGDAPILVITDGLCETSLTVRRDHAFLLPRQRQLPFRTAKPVFTMR